MRGRRQSTYLVVAALLLLGGCVWLWCGQPSGENIDNTVKALISSDIQDDIQQIAVEKENNFYTITKKDEAYTVSGIEEGTVSQGMAENIFYRIVHLESIAFAHGMQEEAAGFLKPLLTLTLKNRNNEVTKIVIGHKSNLLEGYFAKILGKEEIYVIDTDLPEEIYSTAEEYQKMAFIDFIYESDYDQLDYLEIWGQDIISIAFRRTEDGFEMEKPVRQLCDQSTVKNTFLHAAVHLKADEFVGNKEEIEMGFRKPSYLISMKYRGEEIKIRIGEKAGDKRYIKRDGDNAVYLIQESHLTFLDTDYRSAIGEFLYPRSVKEITGVTVSVDGNMTQLTEVTAAGKGYEAQVNGKKLKSEVFLPFYNSIRNLEVLKNISAPGKDSIKIKVFLQDGRSDEIVLGYLNEREYSVSVNGVCSFSTSKASVENLKEKIELLRDIVEL